MKKIIMQVKTDSLNHAIRLLKQDKFVHFVGKKPKMSNIIIWYTTDKQLETINSIINDLNNA